MYYIWSFLISVLIFIIIQHFEYKKNPFKYNLYTLQNFVTLCIIYILTTVIFYFLFEIDYKCLNKIKKGGKIDVITDPTLLKKISEPIYTGFEPFDDSLE